MKNYLLLLFAWAMTLSASAQDTSDAANFFDNKAWGWAACVDEAGTSYQLDGGMRAEKPKTIILTTNGGDNANAIKAAINAYDIIVLDGTMGEFRIDALMKIDNAKNKTIVGRNNAVLATKFFLTSDDIAYLKAQNLEKLSSTDQYTGKLPDGTTMTCDKRAFFTKKAMMELQYQKTGVYSLPNNAGIFQFNSTCENVIVRNITFQGPGAVDIDGSDLLYDAYAEHLWVDHCTFIDSQDGALDTRGGWNTYTWNHFYYTERSFSHAYTCGLGWVTNHSTVLHVTWGYNMWGEGCNRRLPQGTDCFLHLVNNYHNCPGNSAGMTLNDYATALVEGNYAAPGVNSPLIGSGEQRKVYARDNSFTYASRTPVTVPYDYKMISYTQVPAVLTAVHGAGATLDSNFMPIVSNTPSAENFGFYEEKIDITKGGKVIPAFKNFIGAIYELSSDNQSVAVVKDNGEIEAKGEGTATISATLQDELYGEYTATLTVNVISTSGEFETVKKWDFKRGAETTESLAEDGDWTVSGSNYKYVPALDKEELRADGGVLAEAAGLQFTCVAEKLEWYTDCLRLNKENSTVITIPSAYLKAGDKLVIKWKSANSTAQRGFNLTNCDPAQILTDGKVVEKEVNVLAADAVTLTVTGGLYLYSIEVKRQNSTDVKCVSGISEDAAAAGKKFFNVAGQRVSRNARGLKISGGRKFF